MQMTQSGGPVRPINNERRIKVTLMMRPSLKSALKRLADAKGIGYQTLAQQILTDQVHEINTKHS